ncbi:hypothetical protein DENSPDRAFT_845032, partial [Dentipellis sp. KUC8613]
MASSCTALISHNLEFCHSRLPIIPFFVVHTVVCLASVHQPRRACRAQLQFSYVRRLLDRPTAGRLLASNLTKTQLSQRFPAGRIHPLRTSEISHSEPKNISLSAAGDGAY